MAQNLRIDPTKRDYLLKNGSPIPSDRIEEAAYFALAIPQGQWIYGDPDQGSLLYTLRNQKHSASTEQQFASYALDAVERQLVATGKAKAARAGNLSISRSESYNQIQIVPAQVQISEELNFNSV